MTAPADIPTFGTRLDNQAYIYRPSAYVILREGARVAIVRTPFATYLPGGGQDPGETPEAAAIREVAEECGLAVELVRRIGIAHQYVFSDEEQKFFHKYCTFFRARITGSATATETDHETAWVTPEQARQELHHESHRWAIEEDARQEARH